MNVLDEIRALATPSRLLTSTLADGRGVKIAVVDSGIDRDTIAARHPLSPGVQGLIFRERATRPYDGQHSSAHGTTVADILLTIAPAATLYSADVFGPANACDLDTLMFALRHAMDDWGAKIINLSLGVAEQQLVPPARRQQFLRLVEEAYYRDVLIVAAAHNDHPLTRSYPAVFAPPLLSVDKALFAEPTKFQYLLREQVEFLAHSRGYLGPFAQEPATSWAAPHLAGLAARLLSWDATLKPFEVKTLLYWMNESRRIDE